MHYLTTYVPVHTQTSRNIVSTICFSTKKIHIYKKKLHTTRSCGTLPCVRGCRARALVGQAKAGAERCHLEGVCVYVCLCLCLCVCWCVCAYTYAISMSMCDACVCVCVCVLGEW